MKNFFVIVAICSILIAPAHQFMQAVSGLVDTAGAIVSWPLRAVKAFLGGFQLNAGIHAYFSLNLKASLNAYLIDNQKVIKEIDDLKQANAKAQCLKRLDATKAFLHKMNTSFSKLITQLAAEDKKHMDKIEQSVEKQIEVELQKHSFICQNLQELQGKQPERFDILKLKLQAILLQYKQNLYDCVDLEKTKQFGKLENQTLAGIAAVQTKTENLKQLVGACLAAQACNQPECANLQRELKIIGFTSNQVLGNFRTIIKKVIKFDGSSCFKTANEVVRPKLQDFFEELSGSDSGSPNSKTKNIRLIRRRPFQQAPFPAQYPNQYPAQFPPNMPYQAQYPPALYPPFQPAPFPPAPFPPDAFAPDPLPPAPFSQAQKRFSRLQAPKTNYNMYQQWDPRG